MCQKRTYCMYVRIGECPQYAGNMVPSCMLCTQAAETHDLSPADPQRYRMHAKSDP